MQKLPRDFQAFVVAVVFAASALAWILTPHIQWELWPELLLFMGLVGLASMFPIPDPRGGYITATGTLFYVLVSVHGPGAGLMIAGSGYAVGAAISRGWLPWRTLFNGAQMGLSVALAGLVFKATGGSVVKPGVLSFLIPLTLASLTHQMSNNFFVAFYFSRLRRVPLLPTWISDMRDLLWSNTLTIPTAALLAVLYTSVHPLTMLIYIVSLPLQRWALQLYLQQRRIHSQAIDSLVLAIDANFPQGKGHSRRVADTAVAIARHMNLSDSAVEGIELGALLHDVGMIGLDDVIESGPVQDVTVLARLREHVSIGARVARDLPRQDVSDIVRYHHENFDGSGYPLGLKGRQIPVGARIVAVAEAFDSMIAGGFPYSVKLSPSEAVEAIRKQAGKAFDPHVVDAFLASIEAESLAVVPAPEESRDSEVISETGASR